VEQMGFKSGVTGRGSDRWWEWRWDCDEVMGKIVNNKLIQNCFYTTTQYITKQLRNW